MRRLWVSVIERLRDKTHFCWREDARSVRLFGWHFYMTRHVMRRKVGRAYDEMRTRGERRRTFKALWERSGGRCEACGCELIRGDTLSRTERRRKGFDAGRMAQCHHVIPVSMKMSGTWENLDNLSLLCSRCHAQIHGNPIMYAEMIKAKMAELGVCLAADAASTGAGVGD